VSPERQRASPTAVEFRPADTPPPPWDGTVTTPAYSVVHDPQRQGGLPSKITFAGSGKVFEGFRWNNRVHHRESGSWCACDDAQATVELVSDGPVCKVVRVRAHCVQSGKRPPSEPAAVYDWYYFHDRRQHTCAPLSASSSQRSGMNCIRSSSTIREKHFRCGPRRAAAARQVREYEEELPVLAVGVIHDGRQGIGC